jgi:hypothetical protein
MIFPPFIHLFLPYSAPYSGKLQLCISASDIFYEQFKCFLKKGAHWATMAQKTKPLDNVQLLA